MGKTTNFYFVELLARRKPLFLRRFFGVFFGVGFSCGAGLLAFSIVKSTVASACIFGVFSVEIAIAIAKDTAKIIFTFMVLVNKTRFSSHDL